MDFRTGVMLDFDGRAQVSYREETHLAGVQNVSTRSKYQKPDFQFPTVKPLNFQKTIDAYAHVAEVMLN